MKNLIKYCAVFLLACAVNRSHSQACLLTASSATTESTCKATGTITVNASSGSGNYNYTVTGSTYNSTTSSNIIAGLQAGVYSVKVKDLVTGCTFQMDSIIVAGTYQDPRFVLNATDVTCTGASDGSITVGSIQFGKPPFTYSIVAPSASGVGTSNSTGAFTNLTAGNYTIQLTDSCGGIQTRIISIANHTWSITGTAVVKVDCDSSNVTLTATDNNGNTNVSGPGFTGYLYGYVRGVGDTVWSASRTFGFNRGTLHSASFVIKDPCGNVMVSAWTDNNIPDVNATVTISNKTCNTFTARITGQQHLSSPQFCIYDASNVLISCNASGIFNSLPYGSYCIQITDNCYDTTIARCFTVIRPLPVISGINISNKSCTGFTATVSGTAVTNGQYCLYDVNGMVIICNSTGIFNNVPYGTYCVHTQNDPACYDTVLINCFTVTQPVPSVNNTVTITRGCNVFSAAIGGQQNLTNPQYCLYDNSNTLITCNTNGTFTSLSYGTYCIHVINDSACYDTSINVCFTVNAVPVSIGVNANPSCSIGTTDARITLTNGTGPYTINIYDPLGNLVRTVNSAGSPININSLPGLTAGSKYKVVVQGGCGSLDSTLFTPRTSTLTKTINANSKCPAGLWQNGSGDLLINAVFSEGNVTPRIILKDGNTVSINYTTKTGSNFTFSNLGAAVYVVRYTLENCSNFVYDTFDLKSYTFPSLDQSSVYQCNNNSFKVDAIATGGITPYKYEIIGSTPAVPGIVQGPQNSPAFTISNGTTYSVVRLRVIDACGNATINDASILPLGNTVITASSNCYYNAIDLTVDSIPNAIYSWYKKNSPTDSTLIGSGLSYTIPNLLPSDTGVYVSVASVNAGCLTKVSSFDVTGACGMGVLEANGISFSGYNEKQNIQLQWSTVKQFNATKFIVERSQDGRRFNAIGEVSSAANNNVSASRYYFSDVNSPDGKNFYRLRIVRYNNVVGYTQIIVMDKNLVELVTVSPNPVPDVFAVKFGQSAGRYNTRLVNTEGKTLFSHDYMVVRGEIISIRRPQFLSAGLYYLMVTNHTNNQVAIIKLYFK